MATEMDFFAWRVETGAFAAMRCAVSRVSSRRRAFSQTLLTRPHSMACSAVNGVPVRMISFARRTPTARGMCCVPMPPGMMPKVTSVNAKRARRAA